MSIPMCELRWKVKAWPSIVSLAVIGHLIKLSKGDKNTHMALHCMPSMPFLHTRSTQQSTAVFQLKLKPNLRVLF